MLISLLDGGLVKADLPCLDLSLFVNEEGVLESKEMKTVVGCMLTTLDQRLVRTTIVERARKIQAWLHISSRT